MTMDFTDFTDFSFGEYASEFDDHIEASIPGYIDLATKCVNLSRRFVQPGTHVYDIGCSTGRLLTTIHRKNHTSRPGVTCVGIDREPDFVEQCLGHAKPDLIFKIGDVRTEALQKASFVLCNFTLQFIPPMDKRGLLKRLYDCLVDGGAFLIAEKTLAETGRLQDALTFPYYDQKLARGLTAEHILQKERSLRGYLTSYTEAELREALKQVGFRDIERVWGEAPFAAFLALK
jgi:tRNA (cmo5U34)-methyltransferase